MKPVSAQEAGPAQKPAQPAAPAPEQEQLVVIPAAVLNQTLEYLGSCPYKQVANLIHGIQSQAKTANVVPITQEKVQ